MSESDKVCAYCGREEKQSMFGQFFEFEGEYFCNYSVCYDGWKNSR